jgi:hypothetical protein
MEDMRLNENSTDALLPHTSWPQPVA